jgi:hypothetical protein
MIRLHDCIEELLKQVKLSCDEYVKNQKEMAKEGK